MKKKTLLIVVLTFVMAFAFAMPAFAANNNIKVTVNGQQLTFDQQPIMYNNRVMVPFRAIFEALNTTVVYKKVGSGFDQIDYIFGVNDNSSIMMFKIAWDYHNDGFMVRDAVKDPGENILFDVQPILRNNRILVPVRLIADMLGVNVDWNQKTNTVTINGTLPKKWSKAGAIDSMILTVFSTQFVDQTNRSLECVMAERNLFDGEWSEIDFGVDPYGAFRMVEVRDYYDNVYTARIYYDGSIDIR